MYLYEFERNDVINNRIKMYPYSQFFMYQGVTYYNSDNQSSSLGSVPSGYIDLYELNIHREENGYDLVYPYITKDSGLTAFKTISTDEYNQDFVYGDVITGSYPMSASITSEFVYPSTAETDERKLDALYNTLNYNAKLSPSYVVSSSIRNLYDEDWRLISIPSIFYGSTIKKGTVDLKFYLSANLSSRLQDTNKNGELIETTGSHAGNVAGVVLYDQGFVLLTSSYDISDGAHTEPYLGSGSITPQWRYFMSTESSIPSSSFDMTFNGTSYTNTMTMFAKAPKGELNSSNNPTFITHGQELSASVGDDNYFEKNNITVKNIQQSPYGAEMDTTASFERTTYLSSVNIYDEDRNLIAVAKMANPVRKREQDAFNFKLKIDLT